MEHHCETCGKCCKNEDIGPFVFPSDVKGICCSLGISSYNFLHWYCDKKVIAIGKNNYIIYVIKKEKSGCVFLNEFNKCDIYENRPYQCRMVPFGFLAKYEYWKHLDCISEKDFAGVDTRDSDIKKFQEIIKGYNEGGD